MLKTLKPKYIVTMKRDGGLPIIVKERFQNPWSGELFYSEVKRYRPFSFLFRMQYAFNKWQTNRTWQEKLVALSQTDTMRQKALLFVESMKVDPVRVIMQSGHAVNDAEKNTGVEVDGEMVRPTPSVEGKLIVDADKLWGR